MTSILKEMDVAVKGVTLPLSLWYHPSLIAGLFLHKIISSRNGPSGVFATRIQSWRSDCGVSYPSRRGWFQFLLSQIWHSPGSPCLAEKRGLRYSKRLWEEVLKKQGGQPWYQGFSGLGIHRGTWGWVPHAAHL